MSAASQSFVYVLNKTTSRLNFGASNRRITFAIGRNKVDASVWGALETGAAAKYVKDRLLVVVGKPDEDIEVHDASLRGSGVPAQAPAAPITRSPEDEALFQSMLAELAKLRGPAPAVERAAPFDPGALSIAKLDERLSEGGLTLADLQELRTSEENGKNRLGALEAITATLELVEEG